MDRRESISVYSLGLSIYEFSFAWNYGKCSIVIRGLGVVLMGSLGFYRTRVWMVSLLLLQLCICQGLCNFLELWGYLAVGLFV